MLEKLFISKVRMKLLRQYLFNQKEEYHVRGLVRLLEEEINAVRRELQNLESANILLSQRKGNKLFYRVNPACPFLNELKSMFYKDTDEISKILTVRSSIENIEVMLLTHHFLRAKHTSDMDVDILFLGNIDTNKLTTVMKKIEAETGRELRFAVLTMSDYQFRRKNRDPFLLKIMENDKIVLIGSETDL